MIGEKKEGVLKLLRRLKRVKIKSWFDLGIFLDRLQQRRFSYLQKPKSFQQFSSFKEHLSHGSLAFITYSLGIDGVSMELNHYLKVFKKIFKKDFKACLIVGDFDSQAPILKQEGGKIPVYQIQEARGFEEWGEPYKFLYHHKLKRGGEIYNLLPSLIWKQSLVIIERLLNIIEKENIRCFFIANVASNPGNLSLTLSTILLSEVFGIPVINNNHDFYWEDGKNPSDRKEDEEPGVRDHFFTNADLGEVFSVIKTLYPWRSQFWTQVNINQLQTKRLIEQEALNPNAVTEINTALDSHQFQPLTPLQKEKAYYKLNLLFSSLGEKPVILKPGSHQIDQKAQQGEPFIIGCSEKLEFSPAKNLLFLQPTRIIERKQIEENFLVLKMLLNNKKFRKYLKKTKKNLLFLITGPIASGHFEYFQKIKKEIKRFYRQLPQNLKKKFFVAFKFGKDSNENFLSENLNQLSMAETYGITDLVFLLSKTEGRALPIIESGATGVPLIINPYNPYPSYKEVAVGFKLFIWEVESENKEKKKKVIEELVPFIINKKKRQQLYQINKKVVQKRFSFQALRKRFLYILKKLWQQTKNDGQSKKLAYQTLREIVNFRKNSLKGLVWDQNRAYFPGFIPLGFLFYLKSLIDPSFFRIEHLDLRSRIFSFGSRLVDQVKLDAYQRFLFFKALEEIFQLTWGKEKMIIDHSFNYRNRTTKRYLFHQLTEQELKGVVVSLSQKIFGPHFDPFTQSGAKKEMIKISLQKVKDFYQTERSWQEKLKFLFPQISKTNFRLFKKEVINQPRKILFFLGANQDLVGDLKILTEELLSYWQERGSQKGKVYLIVYQNPLFDQVTEKDLKQILKNPFFSLLRDYLQKGLVQIVSLSHFSSGINFYQLDQKTKRIFLSVKEKEGLVFSRGEDHFLSLDLLDLQSFRFGQVKSRQFAHFTNLQIGDYFFQFLPAGLQPVLNYPVPSQQIKEFNYQRNRARDKSNQFWQKVKVRQDKTGEDLKETLDYLLKKSSQGKGVLHFSKIAGKHADGLPWTGVYFKFSYSNLRKKYKNLRFEVIESQENRESIINLVTRVERKTKRKVLVGFNGGFILNNELVGKLGLTEDYVGTPLGLAIHHGEILSLPLYRRPVFAYKKDGRIFIQRLSLPPGKIWVKDHPKDSQIEWKQSQINPQKIPPQAIAVYNLLYDQKVPLKDRVLVTICGKQIADIARPRFQKATTPQKELLPVGIALSFPKKLYRKHFSSFYQIGKKIDFDLQLDKKWQDVREAVEAGPLLVENGQVVLDMDLEGWTTKHSIKSQAARLDRFNQRGPKIALGITKDKQILGIAFNSRTRDSFGISYQEMAEILIKMGVGKAMAFDPGGSTSLYFQDQLLNIPPYNPNYNRKIYYAPPTPRGIANALILTRPA